MDWLSTWTVWFDFYRFLQQFVFSLSAVSGVFFFMFSLWAFIVLARLVMEVIG